MARKNKVPSLPANDHHTKKSAFIPVIFLLAVLLSFGCDDDTVPVPTLVDFTPATIRWAGPPQADGCGFLVIIDSTFYKPSNPEVLPDDMKSAGDSTVLMKYYELNQAVGTGCGFGRPSTISGLEIVAIKLLED